MTDFKEGDVVLVSYPFGEGAGVRKRPALVISLSLIHISEPTRPY